MPLGTALDYAARYAFIASSKGHTARSTLPIARQIRYNVFEFRIADFCLACDWHAVQSVPNHGFDESRRKVGSLLQYWRNFALIFDGERSRAGQSTTAEHSTSRRYRSVAGRAPFFKYGFPVLFGR
jgi:hypothetical protein